jgi:hypothetical protein
MVPVLVHEHVRYNINRLADFTMMADAMTVVTGAKLDTAVQ